MSRVALNIELDKSDKCYLPGEEVSGYIEVQVDKGCRCKALEVSWGWETRGKGNKVSSSRPSVTIFEGRWSDGGEYRYPFSFRLPDGPASYQGMNLSVGWRLRVRARLAMARDCKVETPIFVEPLQPEEAVDYLTGDPEKSHHRGFSERQPEGGMFFGLLAGAALLLLGVLWTAYELLNQIQPEALFISSLSIAAGLIVLFFVTRNRLATLQLGSLEVDVSPRQLRAGEKLRVSVAIPPESEVLLNRVSAHLIGEEKTVKGGGKHATHYRHNLFDDEHLFHGSINRQLSAGESEHFHHRFEIPTTVPPSFYAGQSQIDWSLKVHVDIAGWPDWVKTYPLEIWPQRQEAKRLEEPPTAVEEDRSVPALTGDALW